MEIKKVKVVNPNNFRQGLRLMDGVKEVIVHPKSFVYLDADEVYFINNMSSTFQRRKLIVEDDEINENIGLKNKEDVSNFTDGEIKEILVGNFLTMKKKFGEVKEKYMIDRIIEIAKKLDDLAQGKIKFLSEISGYDVDQIVSKE